jgi:hypothetical protein
VVAAAVAAAPAVADENNGRNWTCIYYKWDVATQHWRRVTIAAEQTYEWEEGNYRPRYSTWDCKYCYVPVGLKAPDPVGGGLDSADATARGTAGAVGTALPDVTTSRAGVHTVLEALGLDSSGDPAQPRMVGPSPILYREPAGCPTPLPPELSNLEGWFGGNP